MNIRGEAAIIGTVLLILAVMVSGGIVAYYAIQQVQSVDSSCLESLNSIQFTDVGFSCRMLDAAGGPVSSFSVKITDDTLEGFQLGIERGGTADTYEVRTGASFPDICLLDSDFAQPLIIPSAGDTLTYVVRGDIQHVFISPILKGGKGCYAEARKDATIENECVNPEVESRLQACSQTGGGSVCGNGVVESGESCDDGTSDADDTYRDALVGDDDGICVVDIERPSSSCEINVCGDGYRNAAHEACDDGNVNNGDGCSNSCQIEPPRICTLTNLQWESTSRREGSFVDLLATSIDCGGSNVSFRIKEDDSVGNDTLVVTQPADASIGPGTVVISRSWVAEWLDDAPNEPNPPEYYFTATLQGGPTLTSSLLNADELKVRACGDLIVDSVDGEQCDGATGFTTCLNVPGGTYTGGILSCYARGTPAACTFDVRNCTGASSICGNGLIEVGETCDDGDATGGDGCSNSCQIENGWICTGQPSACTRCGNGMIDAGEQCDGTIPAGLTCGNYGGVGGSLSCTATCRIDTSRCSFCGDGLVGPGEICDPPGSLCGIEQQGGGNAGVTGQVTGNAGNDVGEGAGICSPMCNACDQPPSPLLNPPTWDQTSAVQDQIVGFSVSGTNVATYAVDLEIYEDDPVGDDLVMVIPLTSFDAQGSPLHITVPAPWQCDLLFGLCDFFEGSEAEFYIKARIHNQPQTEVISSNILITTEHNPTCGNGVLQAGESCDPPQAMCSPGYGGQCTYCTGACTLDQVTGPFCGDGMTNGPEVCDGGTQVCTTASGYLGTRSCNAACAGYGSCTSMLSCGDGIRNGPEQCDGTDLGGQSCTTLGFAGGTLSCSSCTFMTGSCTTGGSVCGNGVVESGESCDPPGSQQSCTVSGGVTGAITGGPSGTQDDANTPQTQTKTCGATCQWGACL